jgi:hypothetical protein
MRKVICCDAFERLRTIEPVAAVITSLPDAHEVECSFTGYAEWFTRGVCTVLNSVRRDGVAIFYQGDRKHNGTLLSKATLLCDAAYSLGFRLLWHKIVLRNRPGVINLYRPSFLHMMAFSRSLKAGRPTPDVIDQSETIYNNGMNVNAAIIAVRFSVEKAKADIIHDPFCGRGTVLAVANALGLRSVGFDIDQEQCARARLLQIKLPETSGRKSFARH